MHEIVCSREHGWKQKGVRTTRGTLVAGAAFLFLLRHTLYDGSVFYKGLILTETDRRKRKKKSVFRALCKTLPQCLVGIKSGPKDDICFYIYKRVISLFSVNTVSKDAPNLKCFCQSSISASNWMHAAVHNKFNLKPMFHLRFSNCLASIK